MLVLESSAIVMLLLHFIECVSSFPSYFLTPSVTVNEFIRYYEPALYDVEEVTKQHKRIKRGARSYEKNNFPLRLTITTSNREFKLLLRPDQSLFTEDVEFEGAKGNKINFDVGNAYIGTLEDDERTKVRGIITADGLFDGTISTQFEEFYVEPLSRYRDELTHPDDPHTIVYKISDVEHPHSPLCSVPNSLTGTLKPTDLNTIAHRSKSETHRRHLDDDALHKLLQRVQKMKKKADLSSWAAESSRSEDNFLPGRQKRDVTAATENHNDAHDDVDDSKWPNFENLFAHRARKASVNDRFAEWMREVKLTPPTKDASYPTFVEALTPLPSASSVSSFSSTSNSFSLSSTANSVLPAMMLTSSHPSTENGRSALTLPHHEQRGSVIDFSGGSNVDGSFYDLDGVNMTPGFGGGSSSDGGISDIGGGGSRPRLMEDDGVHYEFNDDYLNRGLRGRNQNETVIIRGGENNGHWRPKSGIIDSVYKYTNVTKSSKAFPPLSGIIHKAIPKILVGNGLEESRANSIVMLDDSLEQHARKRAIVDPRKTTCMLYLQADHLFFEKYGTEETCIEVMTRHVQRVNSIYRNTDFNLDGKPDNISFMIKRIKVHSIKDPSYRFPGNYGVEKFLEIFSEEDYDAFCLAYMFTYRDFEMGTLGLAWTGDLKNAGGVCEKNGHYRGSLKSLNTGIVTVLNYGKHVPSAVSHVTLAHEIGHNFGSPHDPDGCTPGGDDGNFIMFARATSGDKKNNNKFSPCSLHAINPVLNVKARSSKGCFTEPQTSICGNGVVEPGEECDCGWEEDCKDKCCYPQRRYPPVDETPCRLTPNSRCSPSQGPCCTTECKIKSDDMCRNDNGCRDASYCNGMSPQCPPSINKPNKTVCNEEFVCYMGECTGSICLAYGLESCQCIPTPSDPSTKACELCCKMPGENQPCVSSFQWNQVPYDVPNMYAKPGTPCNDYNGYCDVFRKCREVDPSGPIATLRKLLLSEENIATFKKWALDRWYYCGLIFLSFFLLMFLSIKVLGKKPKVKAVTVVHSSPTEPVRLPADANGGPAVVVHPTAVRSKLPFKKKVHENKRRAKLTKKDESVPHNVNNNNSPVEVKKKGKRHDKGAAAAIADGKNKTQKNKKNVIVMAEDAKKTSSVAVDEDPLGKVRNWLINSHNIEDAASLKKSKSSPAGFNLSDPMAKNRGKRANLSVPTPATATNGVAAAATTVAIPKNTPTTGTPFKIDGVASGKKIVKKSKDRVKLQLVYKPPFKFSVKLGKSKNEIASHLIKDKRPEAVKQRAALLMRADRIRTQPSAVSTASPVATKETPVAATPTATIPSKSPKTNEKSSKSSAMSAVEGSTKKNEEFLSKVVEYKRSVSAPQSEPLYENTAFEAPDLRDEEKHRAPLEPCYANVFNNVDSANKNPFANDSAGVGVESKNSGGGTTRSSKNTSHTTPTLSISMKRRNSSESRKNANGNDATCKVLLQSKNTTSKRRNSCDIGYKATKALAVAVSGGIDANIKRQYSDESDVRTSNLKRSGSEELMKRVNAQAQRVSVGGVGSSSISGSRRQATNMELVATNSKPVRLKFSELEEIPAKLMTKSSTPMTSAFRDMSSASNQQQIAAIKAAKEKHGRVRRSMSNNEASNDVDKFKRYSLQNTDLAQLARAEDVRYVFPNANFESVELPFRPSELTSEIPSDLEVLLSESENTIDGKG